MSIIKLSKNIYEVQRKTTNITPENDGELKLDGKIGLKFTWNTPFTVTVCNGPNYDSQSSKLVKGKHVAKLRPTIGPTYWFESHSKKPVYKVSQPDLSPTSPVSASLMRVRYVDMNDYKSLHRIMADFYCDGSNDLDCAMGFYYYILENFYCDGEGVAKPEVWRDIFAIFYKGYIMDDDMVTKIFPRVPWNNEEKDADFFNLFSDQTLDYLLDAYDAFELSRDDEDKSIEVQNLEVKHVGLKNNRIPLVKHIRSGRSSGKR